MGNADSIYKETCDRKVFDRHEITRERFGLWYCGARDTCNMSFRVVVAPGLLMLYGDAGEIIFLPNDRNSLHWASGDTFRAEYPYYPMTKLSPQMRAQEFIPEDATRWVNEWIREARKQGDKEDARRYIKMAREWKDNLHGSDSEAETAWYALCQDHDVDDPPSCRDFPSRIYVCFQAMCWFMSHVSESDPRFAEEFAEELKS
jgi:hypothetical protein